MSLKTVKLGEICLVRRGTTITKKQTIEGDVPVIGGGTKPTYFHNESNRMAGCITLSGSGASAGFVNRWDIPIFASDCSTVEPKDDTQLSKFIYYYLMSQQQFIYDNFRSGAAQPHVYSKDIEKLNYPILAIEEQRRIVAKLDTAFAEIDKSIKIVEEQIVNAKAIFEKSVISYFSTDKSKSEIKKLSEIATYFNGLTYSPKDVGESGTIVLRSSNIQNGRMDFSDIVRVKKNIKEKLYVLPSDILICSRNGSKALIGKCSLIGKQSEPMTFGTFMMVVRSESNHYLQWFFQSKLFKQQIAQGENTAINQITRYMLDEVILPVPDISTQIAISNHLEAIDTQVRELHKIYLKKINELKALRTSILEQELQSKVA